MIMDLILGICTLIFTLVLIVVERKSIYVKKNGKVEKSGIWNGLKYYKRWIFYALAIILIYFIYPYSNSITKNIFKITIMLMEINIIYVAYQNIIRAIILERYSRQEKQWKEYYDSRNIFEKVIIKIFKINFSDYLKE